MNLNSILYLIIVRQSLHHTIHTHIFIIEKSHYFIYLLTQGLTSSGKCNKLMMIREKISISQSGSIVRTKNYVNKSAKYIVYFHLIEQFTTIYNQFFYCNQKRVMFLDIQIFIVLRTEHSYFLLLYIVMRVNVSTA